MTERVFEKLPLTDLSPEGFLLRQLELQSRGLTGSIRFIWDDLSDDSAWLGGGGESWERGPYYLDGLIPLGFLLNSEELKKEICKWVDHILSSQQESGFFGPAWNADWWPRMVVLKALVPYYHATKDPRIIPFMDRYFSYQYRSLDEHPPVFWASARALEASEALELVYRETGKEYIPHLARNLKDAMYDWFGFFKTLPYTKPMPFYINRTVFNILKAVAEPIDARAKKNHTIRKARSADKIRKFNASKWISTISFTHGVNIAMAVKYPAAFGMISDDASLYPLALEGYRRIMSCHGTAIGLWTSDEHLSGPNPSNGTELCTVAEMMYSLEEVLSITGDPGCADLLELLAYNAFPATFTADMCCHQYVQQVNQIAADRKRRQFFDADSEANTYGLEPNYGCCTANLHQGFPKFAANLCYRSRDGLAFMVYAPCVIKTEIRPGEQVSIRETTEYPFEDRILFEILESEASAFTLTFRIPAFTTGRVFVNEALERESGPGKVSLQKAYAKGDRIEIILEAPVSVVSNPDRSVSFRKGSLLLALHIDEKYIPLRGKEPFNYRQFVPVSEWNLAPVLSNGNLEIIDIIRRKTALFPFDSHRPPLEIRVKGVMVDNWKKSGNSAGPVPLHPEASDPRTITLVPYGCTNIRIAQFPLVQKS